ncbi:MAG: hypothetical protein QM739_07545 [Propionivibrio sp.]
MINHDRKVTNTVTPLIDSFLKSNPQPTNADWKRLIDANPEQATDIAEVAVLFGDVRSLDESAYDETIDENLFNETKSYVLNLVSANKAPVIEARNAVDNVKGPKARAVARDIGLGERVSLYNQVVSGEIKAPYVLLKRLARLFRVQLASLAEVFSANFANRPVPVFKSDNKPELLTEPMSWRQAITAAGITGEEAERLIALEKELE